MTAETTFKTETVALSAAQTGAQVRIITAVAMMIGLGLVWIAGFAHANVLHNAAHDTRHSLAFPCH